ncbi:hypothetical protein [Novosphingobium sp.]|uniref:hypothetical protein n=1 Tax=Novosphingobium sp. TaxID=1874826 RepID=UPI0027372904|nr:hypothetical protein [Novosphingobium sp.]MDP3905797.1 hypothetical protein [Novosphingobium sp.]
MKIGRATIALALALSAAPALGEVLDNSRIVSLVEVGLDEQAIIAKIKASGGQYDTSTDAMIALKKAGVPGSVIAAMIEASNGQTVSANAAGSADSPDPLAPHPSGIYVLANWQAEPKMVVIDPTTSNQTKTGGFLGYALTGGIASMSFKTVVPNAKARVVTEAARPKFYFYFDQAGRSLSGGATSAVWMAGAVTSPSEFSLVRFDVKDDRREAKVGKFNIGGAKAGVMDKARIAFSYNQIAPGVYEVSPDTDLPSGEYGFIYSATTGGGGMGLGGMGAMTSKIFDFSVPARPGDKPAKK